MGARMGVHSLNLSHLWFARMTCHLDCMEHKELLVQGWRRWHAVAADQLVGMQELATSAPRSSGLLAFVARPSVYIIQRSVLSGVRCGFQDVGAVASGFTLPCTYSRSAEVVKVKHG